MVGTLEHQTTSYSLYRKTQSAGRLWHVDGLMESLQNTRP